MRWIRRATLGTVAVVITGIAAGVAYERWSRSQVMSDFPPPGALVMHGGKMSHISCSGDGGPTVILEGGLSVGGSLDWMSVQPGIAEVTRVCSYDRAGILWSEPRGEPRDAETIARELHELLRTSSEDPPYVMVGHSLGGLFVQVYADRFPDEVAGIVFVDSSHPEQFERSPPEVSAARAELDASFPPPRLFRLWTSIGGYRLRLPAPQNPISAFLPRTVPWGFLGEVTARERVSQQARNVTTLGDRPVVVLTAGVGPTLPGVSEEVMGAYYAVWLELQAELGQLSSNSVHRIVEDASHNIQNDNPISVVDAVHDVVNAVREGERLGNAEHPDG